MGDLKGVGGAPRDLVAGVVHQRADFERGFEPGSRKRFGARLVAPLRSGKVALGRSAPHQKPVGLLAQRIERDQPLGERRAAFPDAQETQHQRPRDVAQAFAMAAEPLAERLVRPQRKVFEQVSTVKRKRLRGAA